MLRVCEKLREADEKGRRYGLARAETGYLRALVDAMADTDRLAEVELLKTLGDVNVEKGRLGKDVGKFNTALALYLAAMGREQPTEDKETTTPAKMAVKFQILDKRRATGGNTDSLLVGYAQVMVEAIVNDNSMLETEAIKSLGDVYLKRGTETGDTRNLTRATALYNRALARCHNVHGTVVIVHRLLHTAKVRQDIATTRNKKYPVMHFGALLFIALLYTANVRQDITTTRDKVVYVYVASWCSGTSLDYKTGRPGFDSGSYPNKSEHAPRTPNTSPNTLGKGTLHDFTHFTQGATRTQRQHGVRGQKGHFSAFSAAPSSDETIGQVDDDISFRRYIQTADRDLRNEDLDAAEQNLVAALKLVHDRSKPNKAKETDCLCRLGDVYVERGKRTGEGRKFTQAAALYNASMARTDGDKQNMIAKLHETERQFLRNTRSCNLDCEPCPYSSALDHRKELDNSRVRAKSQLETIHQEHNPYQYDEDDPVVREVEIRRAEAIKNLFKSITVGRREFIQVLTDECIAKLGPPPCKYAFIGLGSQATELVTPYSDLEFAILTEEGKGDDDTRRYFLNLTHYLHLKVINLGETILPAMAIPSLNDYLSEDPGKDWFFDSVTPRGFAFDGFMPWASKTPFGRDRTKTKDPVNLIQTPAELAEYQHLHIALAEGYHLSDILRRVAYLTGDKSLVNDYVNRVSKSVDRSPVLSRLSVSFEDDIRQIENVEPTGKLLNVKKQIYRFPSVAVEVLSVCYGITTPSVWETIEELHKTQRISDEDAHHLTVLISISAELRLRTYIANGGQKDKLSPLTQMKVQLDKHDVDDTFVEGRITFELFHLDASIFHLKAALEEAGSDKDKQIEILPALGSVLQERGHFEKGISFYKRALSVGNAIYGEIHPVFASILQNIGTCWSDLGDQRKAVSYHEQSLKMRKATDGETTPHSDIASSLNNIGKCWCDLGDQRKAISYHEQSLKMAKAIHGETTEHPHIASSLNNLGACWNELGDHLKAIRYYEQSLNMIKHIYGGTTAHPVIASSLNNIANCFRALGNHGKAIRYHKQSLKMRKVIYGETTEHPDIASSLNNIGKCWSQLGDQKKAINYYDQSLKMMKAIYGEAAAHPDVALSLNNIGACWNKLGDQGKAISYYGQSLKMTKVIYGKTTPHPDIANSLNNLGNCWSDLGDQSKAINYYEQSLRMRKAIYGETTPHPNIASTLINIGTSWTEIGDQTKAISYHEQSLKMMKAIYGKTTPHPDIASSLHNIGVCWKKLGDRGKAIKYYEQSLKMRKAIYGETTPHPDIASSLNNIGTCWNELGDQKKAIRYHEQSLKMRKAIHGDDTSHPDVSSSLKNIGNCWYCLGDTRKAIRYQMLSLKMEKDIYGQNTVHPHIAMSLSNIGGCWSMLGDHSKAMRYYKQSLDMMKVLYGDNTAHPNIATLLINIGLCENALRR
ncbi:hypothetical protein Bbelb_188110 [Branchiostoma belcheri]|nr:hypothetical protein Bbelb_188110 [Branchiostoma belcheri]